MLLKSRYKWMTYGEAGKARAAIGSGLILHGISKVYAVTFLSIISLRKFKLDYVLFSPSLYQNFTKLYAYTESFTNRALANGLLQILHVHLILSSLFLYMIHLVSFTLSFRENSKIMPEYLFTLFSLEIPLVIP